MSALADRSVQPLPKGTPALDADAVAAVLGELGPPWTVADGRLQAEYAFPDFAQALAFANTVGALAEAANHHPDLHVAWGKVGIVIWTHSIGGLSENDFILAARIARAA